MRAIILLLVFHYSLHYCNCYSWVNSRTPSLVDTYRSSQVSSRSSSSGSRKDSLNRDSRLFLDACDVLEDELELLFHVRQQMDNEFTATPREVTNRIKEFFSSSKVSASIYISDQSNMRINSNDESHVEAFKQYLITNKSALDVVNVILLVEGCVRTDLPFLSFLPWPCHAEALRCAHLVDGIPWHQLSQGRRHARPRCPTIPEAVARTHRRVGGAAQ